MKLFQLEQIATWNWPYNAGEILLSLLRDPQASHDDRVTAAALAGDSEVLDDALADALLAILRDGDCDVELRCTAALSMAPLLQAVDLDGIAEAEVRVSEATYQRIEDMLEEVYRDPSVPEVLAQSALEASVHAPRVWHRDAVQDAYECADRDWQLTAVSAMSWLTGFDEQIIAALASDDDELLLQAVRAAGAWEINDAWPHIEALLDEDTAIPLFAVACEAAASIRPTAAVVLLSELAESNDEDIAQAAIDALSTARIYRDEYLANEDDNYDDDDDDDDDDYDDDELEDDDELMWEMRRQRWRHTHDDD